MKHHQARKVLKAIDNFMCERNSPKKAESLRDLISILDEYVVGTTNSPTEVKQEIVENE